MFIFRSYHDSLKYTYPGGKLEPGKLLGRFISWSADPEPTLRPLVIDCVALALNIGSRHRSSASDNDLNQNLSESKRIIVNDDNKMLYDGVKVNSTWILKNFKELKFFENFRQDSLKFLIIFWFY